MQDMAHVTKAPAAHQAAHSKTPSNRFRFARGCAPPSGGLCPVRGGAPPSSEVCLARGCASLERGPPRPRPGSASLEGTPQARACSCAQALNALTSAGRRHHAPEARAPVPPHQLPRREPIPITVGGGTVRRGRCQSRDAVPPAPVRLTRRALEGGPAAPSIGFLVTCRVRWRR
jgi:hypothetical protein